MRFFKIMLHIGLFSLPIDFISGQVKFEPIPDSNRTIIFLDEFNDNSKGWPTKLDNSKVKISKGIYSRVFSGIPSVEECGLYVEIPDSSDFEIIAEVNYPKDWFNFHSIIFGASNQGDKQCYTFGLNNSEGESKECSLLFGKGSIDGFYKIETSGIRRYKLNIYNELRIRCIKNVFYFYLNKEFIFYARKTNFFGNYIGIGSWGGRTPTTINCERIEVALIK